jgi:hypothetical protein
VAVVLVLVLYAGVVVGASSTFLNVNSNKDSNTVKTAV